MTQLPARRWIIGALTLCFAGVAGTWLLTGDEGPAGEPLAADVSEQPESSARGRELRPPDRLEDVSGESRRPVEAAATENVAEPVAPRAAADPVPAVLPELPPTWKATLFGDVGIVGQEQVHAETLELKLVDRGGVEHHPDTLGPRYEFADLDAGRYWLQAGGRGQRQLEIELELLDRENRRLDLELEPVPALTLTATTDDGQPLVWALEDLGLLQAPLFALAVPWPEPAWPDVGRAQHFGRFISQVWMSRSLRIDRENARTDAKRLAEMFGSLELLSDEASYVGLFLGRSLLASLPIDPERDRLDFRIDTGTLVASQGRLEIHVVDADTGAFLEGGTYQVNLELSAALRELHQGKLVREPCPVGQVLIKLEQPGYGTFHRSFEVTGRDDPPHVLRLEAERSTFRVRVLFPDGSPAPDASVSYLDEEVVLQGHNWGGDSGGRTDAKGWLELPVPSRPRMLRASAPDPDFDFDPQLGSFAFELPSVSSHTQRVGPDEKPGNRRTLQLLARSKLILIPDPAFADGSFRLFDTEGFPLSEGQLRGSAPKRVPVVPDLYRLEVYDRQGAGPWSWTIALGNKLLEWPIGP